jgi:uncharacterized membrane protein YeaQ/YmgE (transglycosylase-associated protein family)
MTSESLIVLLVVGLVAGWLASVVVGSAGGLVTDIIVGVIGAFLGRHMFHWLGVRVPLHGMGGAILVSFVGAVVLLLLLRLVFNITRR